MTLEGLKADGFALRTSVAEPELIASLLPVCPATPRAGVRRLLERLPQFGALAMLPRVKELVEAALGRPGFVTRAILFDKSPGANWVLGFHQDVVIAVEAQADLPGFGPWSIKDGVPHVRPPAQVLERMVTVRIHLDDCGEDNGPLEVIPGSHAKGFLEDDDIAAAIQDGPIVRCPARAGDAVVMRPLLLHASGKAVSPAHRRVAHFEFACDPLPAPLRWNRT